jgi:hypothetical protein
MPDFATALRVGLRAARAAHIIRSPIQSPVEKKMLFPELIIHDDGGRPYIKSGQTFRLEKRTGPIRPDDIIAYSTNGVSVQSLERHVGVAITKRAFAEMAPRESVIRDSSVDYPTHVFVKASSGNHWFSSQDDHIWLFVQDDPGENIHVCKGFRFEIGDVVAYCAGSGQYSPESVESVVSSTSIVRGVAVSRDEFKDYWRRVDAEYLGLLNDNTNYPSHVFIKRNDGVVCVCPQEHCWLIDEHSITKEKLHSLGIKITKKKLDLLLQAIDAEVKRRSSGSGLGELGNAFRETFALRLKEVKMRKPRQRVQFRI